MRRSFFLHLAIGLLSWSSQALGASADREVLVTLSNHPQRMDGTIEKRSVHSLPMTSSRKATNAADPTRE